jgi:hypothetical protein
MIPRNTALRIARATDNLHEITKMYTEGLGFEVIGGFDGHGDFNGRMLGHPKHHYHLEFTSHSTEKAGRAPTQENLLVYYVPDGEEFELAIQRISTSGFIKVQSFNPYWENGAQTFEDLDGYRVVISNSESPY